MSFTITYRKLFTVRVRDADTLDPLRLLQFEPSGECVRLLERYKLVFRSREAGFDVFYGMYPDAADPIVSPIESRERFTFSIRVRNAEFFGAYEPSGPSLPQFYLDNLDSDGNINNTLPGNLTAGANFNSEDLATIHPRTYTQRTAIPSVDPPTEWQIRSKFNPAATLQTVSIPAAGGAEVVYVRVNDDILADTEYIESDGPFRLRTDRPSPPEATIYLSDALSRKRINGVLDVHWDAIQSSAPSPDGRSYQILLKRI